MSNKKLKNDKKSGFSLIEISIVILIISLFLVSVFAGSALLKRFSLATARSLTKSSPVPGAGNLVLWLETSLEDSYASDLSDGNPVTNWKDISPVNNKSDSATANLSYLGGLAPVYSNTIGSVPAIRFNNYGGGGYYKFNASFLNGSDYTIFLVEQRDAGVGSGSNYMLGNPLATSANSNLLLGYNDSGTLIHSQSGTSVATNTSAYSVRLASASNKPNVYTFSASDQGKAIYVNSILAARSTDTAKIRGLTDLYIGNGYNGQIGELIIYNKKLPDQDIADIIQYLSKKWNVNIATSAGGSGGGGTSSPILSCLNGVIKNNQCVTECPVNVLGSTTPSVSLGSGSISCNQTGYSGSIPYTCFDGSLISGSCQCATNYVLYNGTCQQRCSVSGIQGVTNQIIDPGVGRLSCGANYVGSVNYQCLNNTLSTNGSCVCPVGYYISGTSCNPTTCSISNIVGISNRTVSYSSSPVSLNCDLAGYEGDITYTCTSNSSKAILSGTCTCAPGYSLYQVSCHKDCKAWVSNISNTVNTYRSARIECCTGGCCGCCGSTDSSWYDGHDFRNSINSLDLKHGNNITLSNGVGGKAYCGWTATHPSNTVYINVNCEDGVKTIP